MKPLFLLLSCFIVINTHAQTAPGIIWQKTIGCESIETANSFIIDNQGNYIIAGQSGDSCNFTGPVFGFMDGWMIKLDKYGNKLWSATLGGDSADAINKVIQTSDSGYVAVGYTQSTISGSSHKGSADYWIVKLDVNGNVLWQKTYGSSGFDVAYDVIEADSGTLMVAGAADAGDGDVTNYKGGPADAWIVKLSSSGNLLWQKTYGSSMSDAVAAIKRTSDGNFIITGMAGVADSDIHFVHGIHDVWVYKINDTGSIIWNKTYGGSGFQAGECIIQTKDGGYLVGASTNSDDMDITTSYGGNDMWVLKLDDTGRIQWQKSYGGSLDDYVTSIEQTDDGYFLGGMSSSNDGDATGNHGAYTDVLLVKTDSIGNKIWSGMYGGSSGEECAGAYQLTDSLYVIGSITNSHNGDVAINNGATNAWLFKIGDSTTSVREIAGMDNIKVYPTVTDDIVNINLPHNAMDNNPTITLFDLMGKVVKAPMKRQQDNYTISLQGQPAGMYILNVISNGQSRSYKVIYQP